MQRDPGRSAIKVKKLASGQITLRWIAAIAVGFGGLLAGTPKAHADMFTPSVADQIRLGDQAASQVEHQYPVLHDARAAHLNGVGNRLLRALGKDRGPWHWKFHLIQSSELNAFALPGGNLYFFTGLYDKIHDDNALAAVIGHEMTHVRKQHWAKMTAESQKRQLGLSVLLGVAHANNSWRTLAGLGDSLLNLKFSRGDEEQADVGGLGNMVHAGYNPNGMIKLFHILQANSRGGGPEFLSDHPLTGHRIQAARSAIRRMGYNPIA